MTKKSDFYLSLEFLGISAPSLEKVTLPSQKVLNMGYSNWRTTSSTNSRFFTNPVVAAFPGYSLLPQLLFVRQLTAFVV